MLDTTSLMEGRHGVNSASDGKQYGEPSPDAPSPFLDALVGLDPDTVEAVRERAAIQEFDGGLPEDAKRSALRLYAADGHDGFYDLVDFLARGIALIGMWPDSGAPPRALDQSPQFCPRYRRAPGSLGGPRNRRLVAKAMDITSGMALTYDILYSYLSPTDRATLRAALKRSIDTIQPRFAVGQYWTEDFQNNHIHNRIHGLAHASFAMYGDDPAINVQTAADLAVGCFTKVTQWLPDDGSTHEGAGYWDYGYPWVARTALLIEH